MRIVIQRLQLTLSTAAVFVFFVFCHELQPSSISMVNVWRFEAHIFYTSCHVPLIKILPSFSLHHLHSEHEFYDCLILKFLSYDSIVAQSVFKSGITFLISLLCGSHRYLQFSATLLVNILNNIDYFKLFFYFNDDRPLKWKFSLKIFLHFNHVIKLPLEL